LFEPRILSRRRSRAPRALRLTGVRRWGSGGVRTNADRLPAPGVSSSAGQARRDSRSVGSCTRSRQSWLAPRRRPARRQRRPGSSGERSGCGRDSPAFLDERSSAQPQAPGGAAAVAQRRAPSCRRNAAGSESPTAIARVDCCDCRASIGNDGALRPTRAADKPGVASAEPGSSSAGPASSRCAPGRCGILPRYPSHWPGACR